MFREGSLAFAVVLSRPHGRDRGCTRWRSWLYCFVVLAGARVILRYWLYCSWLRRKTLFKPCLVIFDSPLVLRLAVKNYAHLLLNSSIATSFSFLDKRWLLGYNVMFEVDQIGPISSSPGEYLPS